MSRTLSQIYTQATTVRNNYLQLTSLNPSVLSSSKMSLLNALTYIVSALIYSYETILDAFEVNLLGVTSQRMPGTDAYYLRMSKLFQYNEITGLGDTMVLDEETLNMKYETEDADHRIITHVAYQYDNDSKYDLILKVCKDGEEGEEGACKPLSNHELTAFKKYIDTIKFIGTEIQCISCPGDILYINTIVYYDDTYITADQASEDVRKALIDYINNLDYNSYVYFQSVIDAIQAVSHIKFVDGSSTLHIRKYNSNTREYEDQIQISDISQLYAGYATFIDENGISTLIMENCANKVEALASTANIKFVPQSSL